MQKKEGSGGEHTSHAATATLSSRHSVRVSAHNTASLCSCLWPQPRYRAGDMGKWRRRTRARTLTGVAGIRAHDGVKSAHSRGRKPACCALSFTESSWRHHLSLRSVLYTRRSGDLAAWAWANLANSAFLLNRGSSVAAWRVPGLPGALNSAPGVARADNAAAAPFAFAHRRTPLRLFSASAARRAPAAPHHAGTGQWKIKIAHQ